MCILFWASMIPEWRELLRLRREGGLEDLTDAREVRVLGRRDGGTARQLPVSDLLSRLCARLGRKEDKH